MPTPEIAPGAEMPPEDDFSPSNRFAVRIEDTAAHGDGVAHLLEADLRPGGPGLSLNCRRWLRALLERLLVLPCWRWSARLSLHDQAAPATRTPATKRHKTVTV